MSDKELLERALSFDAGLPLIVNGRISSEHPELDFDSCCHVLIENRAKGKWAICNARSCLAKSGRWWHESMPSSRTERFKKLTRFDSAEEAFEFYEKWKAAVMNWLDKQDRVKGSIVYNMPEKIKVR